MSEKSPEAHVKDALALSIRQMLRGEEQVMDDERRLRESKSETENRKRDAQRYHAALLVLMPSTEKDFDKFVLSFQQANPS